MPAVHFAIAAIPVAVYFLLVGALRLRTRPLITSGWRDTLTLGIAASGLVAIGPMQLFFPAKAASQWHEWVWLALFALYGLGLTMVMLGSRPRLVAYGMNERQFTDCLLLAARQVDERAHWDSDVLSLPEAALQLALEPSGSRRVHQVTLVGYLRDMESWLKLEREFVKSGQQISCPRATAGWPLVMFGGMLLAWSVLPLLSEPDQALAQLKEFLTR